MRGEKEQRGQEIRGEEEKRIGDERRVKEEVERRGRRRLGVESVR